MKKLLIRLGQFFYRIRAWIAVPFFIVLVILARPASFSLIPYLPLLFGLLLRIWAAGYIGTKSRANRFSTGYIITNGPYRYLKHPLYIGNMFLVVGVILLFNPPFWYTLLLIVIFAGEYSIIIYSELNYLKNLPKKRVKFHFTNAKGEISTIIIVITITFVHYFLR